MAVTAPGEFNTEVPRRNAWGNAVNTDLQNLDTGKSSTGHAHDASEVSIADAGGHYTGAEVEAALQEAGEQLVSTPPLSGYWVGPSSAESSLLQNGWANGASLWNPTEFVCDAVEFEVVTGAASSTFRPIVWRGDLTAFLIDAGIQPTDTAGVQVVVLGAPVTVPRGWIWMGGVGADGGSGVASLRGIRTGRGHLGMRLQDDNQTQQWPGAIYTAGATEPQAWNGSGGAIVLRLRIA